MLRLARLPSMSRWASVRVAGSATARRGSVRRGVNPGDPPKDVRVVQPPMSNAAAIAAKRMIVLPMIPLLWGSVFLSGSDLHVAMTFASGAGEKLQRRAG